MTIERLRASLADRYRIERELGAGGMATVYLAEDLRHHRKVAMKVLRPELAATLGPDRFLREIEVAARLHHPHILPLYDSGEAAGFLFYVMPYEEGHSLRERLEKEKELPIRDVVRLLHDVVDALANAHHSGLVHRDIKPENVMLSGRHALVTDFGVAKAVSEATGRQKLTTIGVALGTPAYMAPEQAAADPHIDHRADIYAVGVLAYELLTGRPPFTGLTPQAVLAAQVTQPPTPVSELRATVPPALATLVMKCLEKKPADRYQSAEEMLPLLEALATPSGGTTPIGTAPYAGVRSPTKRHLVSGAGALALLAVLGWLGWRTLQPSALAIGIADIRQVSREREPEIHVAISPDGREVAYESGYPGATHIVVRDVAGGRPLSLTGDWGGTQRDPHWTPDGRGIAFTNVIATADHGAGIWTLPRMGGQAVASDPSATPFVSGGLALFVRGDSVLARHADGSETLLLAGISDAHSPAGSPDGSALAYVRGNVDYVGSWGNIAPSAIWVVPVGGTPVAVTDAASLNMSPAWLPDGTLLFISNRDGARDIYAVRLDRSGKPRAPPTRLTTGLEAYSISVSADGTTAVYDRFILRRNLYAIPIPRSGSVSLREARPVTTGNQTIESMDLSVDGKWIAFDSNLEGNQDIYVMPAGGGEPRRVTRNPGDDFSPDFSPDGREITFHSTRNATRDIYVINTDGTNERRLTTDEEQSFHPAFSPDGLRIAYGNFSQTVDLMQRPVLDAPWATPERLALSGFAPRWSPDGSRLVCHEGSEAGSILLIALNGASQTLITGGTAGLRFPSWPEWAPDGRLIYFRALGPDGVQSVYEAPLAGGRPRLLVRFDDPAMPVFVGSIVVGNGMFFFAVGEMESDIYVMKLVKK